ncbi:MAG: adenylyl-sulfate kinase [Verrucomicrobia bacterium]|nr:adenylyl-sulfate kinase [Verrucomicrobiota bacterium]
MQDTKATHVRWQQSHTTREERTRRLRQEGCTVWLTGLPASGKSTLAFTLEHDLITRGHVAYALDGDNVRHGLNSDLGFSAADRQENIRRIGEVAGLFADSGIIAIVSFISPFRAGRDQARAMHQARQLRFFEIFLSTPLAICEQRDPKGLYRKARAGLIKNVTGLDDPYEAPLTPELTLDTTHISPQQAAGAVLNLLVQGGVLKQATAAGRP